MYNDYEKLHLIALEYKKGNTLLAAEIIYYFEPFINSYIRFLVHNEYYIENYSIRNFIGLYNSNLKSKINQYKKKKNIKTYICDTVQKINYVISNYEECEIYNECVCAILEMANNYKDTKPSFHVYVKRCFHYYLKINLDKNSTTYKFSYNIDDYELDYILYDANYETIEEILNNTEKHYIYKKYPISIKEGYSVYDDEHIKSLNWELGLTCSEKFCNLNNFERFLLVGKYILNKTDAEVAIQYGLARETINRKKQIAISKIIK